MILDKVMSTHLQLYYGSQVEATFCRDTAPIKYISLNKHSSYITRASISVKKSGIYLLRVLCLIPSHVRKIGLTRKPIFANTPHWSLEPVNLLLELKI